ncbi:hypothetical protein Tco_1273871 [Tanacetum coccineum]
MDGGEDGDDNDSDSSGDDADDEDEDEEDKDKEDEEEEEHLAPADSAVVIPTIELISAPEGTEPASISLPPEAEVERLLAIPTLPPSPPISLSPPSAGERLARCMALSAHSSLPPGQMVEILRVMRDMRREMSDMQAELLALRGQ